MGTCFGSRSDTRAVAALLIVLVAGCGGGSGGGDAGGNTGGGGNGGGSGGAGGGTTSGVALLAWNDLGMHCMDKDFAVFSLLPPFNNLHAQLVDRATGSILDSGIDVSYESTVDEHGSVNSSSASKVNFWKYAQVLYGAPVDLADNVGLTGFPMASPTPAAMQWNPDHAWYEAPGIPITPYDDARKTNHYPMVKVVARATGSPAVLATARVVLPVSDEMSCAACHASNSGAAAKPGAGWVNDADPQRDWRLNILRLHDEHRKTQLFASATSGTPVLCASCHASNALPGSGQPGLPALTSAIHGFHAHVIDPSTGHTLDDATDRSACYSCHPGSQTKCLRGAMSNVVDVKGNSLISCQSCHGNMSAVGATQRQGWFEEPACQSCHFDGQRALSVFDANGSVRAPLDDTFASNPDTPAPGFDLYRFSTGHGDLQCEACHGAMHAIYPSDEANDNVLARDLQGHAGTIAECSACHAKVPVTASGGPHGLHTTGQTWVGAHPQAARRDLATCSYCHGADYRGTALSAAPVARTFSGEGGARSFSAGHRFSCYDCHNGPSGGD